MSKTSRDIYVPLDAEIIDYQQESTSIFTLRFKFSDSEIQKNYRFAPGQFNMLYLFGVGEIALSVVSDPEEKTHYAHTIRRVGRVTHGLSLLKPGDHVGIRGPFGRGWPLQESEGQDVLIITGGLGCAPSVSVIDYIGRRRDQFGKLTILQGVKHSDDFIFQKHYERWATLPNTQVLLAADVSKPGWPWYTGLVTELIEQADIDKSNTVCLLCGPEAMLQAAVYRLIELNLPKDKLYLNLERNMECAVGHCGHCQFGGHFVCKDGPVFCYPDIQHLLGKKGF